MKTKQKFRDPIQVRSQFIFPKLQIFYPIAYMIEPLYADNTITEELRNAKSNQNIRG